MADTKRVILKEISLWKKRFNDSKKTLREAYEGLGRDAKKVAKEVKK
jgi:hypothetical protein